MGFLKCPMGKFQNKSSRSSYKLTPHGSLSTKPHGSLSTKPKSLTQLAAEKMEQSIKRPAKQPSRMPSLTQLAARALGKDRIKHFEELSDKQTPTISLDKIPVSLQSMRNDELTHARVSKYKQQSSFQNLFHDRLQQIPGK